MGVNYAKYTGIVSIAPTEVLNIGPLDGNTPSSNGASINGNTLYMQSASSSEPGLVNTATQTLAGLKTFSSSVNTSGSYEIGGNIVLSKDSASDPNVYVGQSPSGSITTANSNSFIGNLSGAHITSAARNTAVGDQALTNLTTGSFNNAVGYQAGGNITSANNNTLMGYSAGATLTTGINNTLFGNNSGLGASTANYNAAVGEGTLFNLTTGSQNTAVGRQALVQITSPNNNVGIGYNAGFSLTTGASNTFLGANTDTSSASITNATAVGAGVTVAASNTVILGSGGVNVGVDSVTSPTARLELPAGTASAHSAPLKLDSGTNMTSPESGAIEYDGTKFYFTNNVPTRTSLSGNNSGDVTIGTANGLSLSGQQLSLGTASSSTTGALTSTDWTTFNNKQAGPLTGDVTSSGTATTVAKIQGTTVSGTTGTGNVVFSSAPTMTNPVVGTQSQGNNSTKAASTAYVDTAVSNAVAGLNPAVAVQAATTASSDTSGFTYNNGVSGVGATFTGSTNTAVTIDGFTFTALGQRLLVKNDTQSPSGAFNGIYYVTQLQTALLPPILTRALDYDQPSDINNTGAIPVINGTVNGTTSWVLTSTVNTVGTDPLTFTKFTRNPADYLLKANNLSDVASASTSFNNISPMTTGGDIIYGGASGAGTRLANGSSGQVLTSNGGTSAPSWQAAPGSVTGSYSQAYFSSSSSWTTTSTSFADGTNSGGNTLTVRQSSGITLTAASSNVCGITFTPASSSAVYMINANVSIYNNTAGDGTFLQMTDGTTVISGAPAWAQGATAADVETSLPMFGIYVPGTASAVTVKIQIAVTGGTGQINPSGNGKNVAVEWSVIRIV